jgi:hypothetical protein
VAAVKLCGSVSRPFANGRHCRMLMTSQTPPPAQASDEETWHVQYRRDAINHLVRYPTPQAAIQAACHLIDDGWDVYSIGTGALTDSVGQKEIARIYALWAKAKP